MPKRQHKERLTVTVDPALVRAGNRAVRAGSAESLSAWVNRALIEQVAKDERMKALGAAIHAYEAEYGVITEADIQAQLSADQRNARHVRRRGSA